MAITSSAKKAIRNADKKRVYNLRRLREVKEITKEIEKLVAEGKVAEAQKALPNAYKQIDKAAKMNTFKKNTASRKKSRLSALIKKAKAK